MKRCIFTRPRNLEASHGMPLSNGIYVLPAESIPPEHIEWFWFDWLAKGKLHILAGGPGSGKTTLVMQIVAVLTNNALTWPDGSKGPVVNVIIWSGEDGIADTIIPRLIAAGAELGRVFILQGTVEHGRRRTFVFEKDFELLRAKILEIGNVGLVVIDSIAQIVAGDSNKSSDVRRVLTPLSDMGEQFGCAILGITHINKSSGGKSPLDRITGSLAYGAAARIAMFVTPIQSNAPDAPKTCVLVRAKINIGPDDGGYEYQIQGASFQHGGDTFRTSRVVLNPVALQGSAKEIIRFAESGGVSVADSAVGQAAQFLMKLLSGGGQSFQVVEGHAKAAGIPMSAIKRAKSVVGIRSEKQAGTGMSNPPTFWLLPDAPAGDDAQHLEHRQPMPRRMSETFANPSLYAQTAPAERVAPVAPVAPVEETAPNQALMILCGDECQRLFDHATQSGDDDALTSVDEIIDAALKLYVDDGTRSAQLIDQYRIALRQYECFSCAE